MFHLLLKRGHWWVVGRSLLSLNVFLYIDSIYMLSCSFCREELEKQKAHERYMKLQEQGKTEQARKDLGENSVTLADTLLLWLCISKMHKITATCSLSLLLEVSSQFPFCFVKTYITLKEVAWYRVLVKIIWININIHLKLAMTSVKLFTFHFSQCLMCITYR